MQNNALIFIVEKSYRIVRTLSTEASKPLPHDLRYDELGGSLWRDGCHWLGWEDLTRCMRSLLLMTAEDLLSLSLIVACSVGGFSPLGAAIS